jgi:hypothetical protein
MAIPFYSARLGGQDSNFGKSSIRLLRLNPSADSQQGTADASLECEFEFLNMDLPAAGNESFKI